MRRTLSWSTQPSPPPLRHLALRLRGAGVFVGCMCVCVCVKGEGGKRGVARGALRQLQGCRSHPALWVCIPSRACPRVCIPFTHFSDSVSCSSSPALCCSPPTPSHPQHFCLALLGGLRTLVPLFPLSLARCWTRSTVRCLHLAPSNLLQNSRRSVVAVV